MEHEEGPIPAQANRLCVRHTADLIYGEADLYNVTAPERDQVPLSKPGPEIWRKRPPPE